MVAIPETTDKTLAAADAALVEAQTKRFRPYLGMSAIGAECARQLWYGFRWVKQPTFDAATLKRFADGHASEAVVVARLKAVAALELHDVGEDGEQFGFIDLGGHFKGHMDGVVLGLLQAPKTWHVLEVKATSEKKLAELRKAKADVGEKHALRKWNPIYYAQAVLYMHYAGLDRHYLVCASAGARDWISVRTDADPAEAERLMKKAEMVAFAAEPPPRIGGVTHLACRWCDFAEICHHQAEAQRNCRTCLSVTPERDGCWSCAFWDVPDLDLETQEKGCKEQRFIPGLVPFEQTDLLHGRDVVYRRPDGTTWVDEGPKE